MNGHNNQSNLTKIKIRSVVSPTIWLIGLLYTVYSHFNGCPHAVILGGWLMGPPLWLWFEYQFFFDNAIDDWKSFKHTQSLQRNLWLGVSAFLALKYLPIS
jgi:hypothetical protein